MTRARGQSSCLCHVRFAPESGHSAARRACPLCANYRHRWKRSKSTRKYERCLSEQRLRAVPQSSNNISGRFCPCHSSRLACPGLHPLNVVVLDSCVAHRLCQPSLHGIWSRCRRGRFRCCADIRSRDATARSARKPSGDHRIFWRRSGYCIGPSEGNLSLGATQKSRPHLHRRCA
jgi:hypothetical protein